MKRTKKYQQYKNETQNFHSMVNHSQNNLEFQSQLEEVEEVDKKKDNKREGALTKQITS